MVGFDAVDAVVLVERLVVGFDVALFGEGDGSFGADAASSDMARPVAEDVTLAGNQ